MKGKLAAEKALRGAALRGSGPGCIEGGLHQFEVGKYSVGRGQEAVIHAEPVERGAAQAGVRAGAHAGARGMTAISDLRDQAANIAQTKRESEKARLTACPSWR